MEKKENNMDKTNLNTDGCSCRVTYKFTCNSTGVCCFQANGSQQIYAG